MYNTEPSENHLHLFIKGVAKTHLWWNVRVMSNKSPKEATTAGSSISVASKDTLLVFNTKYSIYARTYTVAAHGAAPLPTWSNGVDKI